MSEKDQFTWTDINSLPDAAVEADKVFLANCRNG